MVDGSLGVVFCLSEIMVFSMHKTRFLSIFFAWIILWSLPWAEWLEPLPWIRLVLAMIMFIVPGMAVSMILSRDRFTFSGHISNGMALSVAFISILGLIGRIFHLSFDSIKIVFALTGLVVLLVLSRFDSLQHQLYRPRRNSLLPFFLLICMSFVGVVISLQHRFGIDDFSYLAYLTTWQHSQALNFQDVFFGLGDLGQIRFLLALFPMNLALWSELSHLHGLLLLGFYLEPVLVVFALLATYNLYEDFLPSKHDVIIALLLVFTFLLLRQGTLYANTIFFNRLPHDKSFAAFILAPVFFLAIRYFLQSYTLKSAVFLILIGAGLSFTHPIILTYCIFIAGVYVVIVTVMEKNHKKMAVTLILFAAILLPQALLRFVDTPLVSRYVLGSSTVLKQPGRFDLESALTSNNIDSRIAYIEGTPFYGFDLKVIKLDIDLVDQENPLQIFFSWGYLWLLGLGFLWSLYRLRENSSAPLILAASFLVLLGAIPYTGWLMGYFVTARLLGRTTWLLPIGLIGVNLLSDFSRIVFRHLPLRFRDNVFINSIGYYLVVILTFVLLTGFVTQNYNTLLKKANDLDIYRNKLERLVDLGSFLERDLKKNTIFIAPTGSQALINYLPGLSSKSKVVFFRTDQFSIHPVNRGQVDLVVSPDDISIKKRVAVLKKYNVDCILVENKIVKEYYSAYPDLFRIQEFQGFWIIHFLDARKE